MKITLYEFNILPDNEKADTVWENGVFLLNRVVEGNAINLYSLNDFYVEIWYDQPNNKIIKIRSFKSTNPLDPYLDDISLGLN